MKKPRKKKPSTVSPIRELRLLFSRYAVVGITGKDGLNKVYDLKLKHEIPPPMMVKKYMGTAPLKWFMHMMTVDTDGGFNYEIEETAPAPHHAVIDHFNTVHAKQMRETENALRAVWVSTTDGVLSQETLISILLHFDAWEPIK